MTSFSPPSETAATGVINLAGRARHAPLPARTPPSLSWIEADLPGMVEEKDKLMAGEEPACALSREPIDLADPTKRSAFRDRVVRSATKVLIITEGLLGYLDSEVVRSIGQDLLGRPAVRWWLLDVASPAILKMMHGVWGRTLPMRP